VRADCADSEQRLIAILQLAYSGERAAALAYSGHWRSLRDRSERERVREVGKDELHHRELIAGMLVALGAGTNRLRELRAGVIGRTLGIACYVSGWLAPMYGAGELESRNIREYEQAARYAWAVAATNGRTVCVPWPRSSGSTRDTFASVSCRIGWASASRSGQSPHRSPPSASASKKKSALLLWRPTRRCSPQVLPAPERSWRIPLVPPPGGRHGIMRTGKRTGHRPDSLDRRADVTWTPNGKGGA